MGYSSNGKFDVCSGHGRCLSLRDAANYVDGDQFTTQVSYSDWDADMVYGCDCNPGWEGSSCSRKSCPKGDDPYTSDQIYEVQIIDCQCSGNCAGSFSLVFKGEMTAKIPLNASAELLKYRLEVIS